MKPTLEAVRDYWNRYVNDTEVCRSEAGSVEFFDELEAYRYEKLSYLRDYVGFEDYHGLKVLEVGCGPGVDLLQFARAGADIWAVDLTPNGVAMARRNLVVHGFEQLCQHVKTGNAEGLEFESGTFDVVYSNGVLHHTVDTESAIEEVRRVLRPGGEAIIMLYNRYSWMTFLSKLTRTNIEHPKEEAPIVRGYSTRQCRRMFSRFGGPIEIHVDRPPVKSRKFEGLKGKLFNDVFVPLFNMLPAPIRRPFGFHILIRTRRAVH